LRALAAGRRRVYPAHWIGKAPCVTHGKFTNFVSTIYVTALQKFSSVGSQAGITYANYSLDDTAGTSYDDITAVYFQTKLNF
jgi:hypothetical protein